MPRVRRQTSGTGIYHVFVRGINKEFIFNQTREKKYLKKIICKHINDYDVQIYAYCIMSTHAHLLIKAKQLSILSMFMSKVLAEYAAYYNFKKKRNGHVFQNRFKSEVIEDTRYLWNCLKYIHLNPVKAKMVANVLQYKYSSIHDYKKGYSKIISEEAIRYCFERFTTWKEMLEFHGVYGEGFFLDTVEEQKERAIEIAWNLLWQFQEENNLDTCVEILEEPELRMNYVEKMKKVLNFSDAQIKRIYKEIEKNVII